MIREWIEYLSTDASPLARQFKLVQQSIAIKERYLRCETSWSAHLNHCHNFIQAEIYATKAKSVAILGSGHLLETPISLFESFERIDLYDFVFPNSIRKIARLDPRIRLFEADLSGVLQELKTSLRLSLSGLSGLPGLPIPQPFKLSFQPDLLVSANILSQLPIHPVSYLMKKYPLRYTEQELVDFITNLLKSHLATVHQHGQGFLISDFKKITTDYNTQTSESDPTLMGLEPLAHAKIWDWQIIPRGEIENRTSTCLKVLATRL